MKFHTPMQSISIHIPYDFSMYHQSCFTERLGNEIATGDGDFLRYVVTGKTNDVHAISQRTRYGTLIVRSAHKQHLAVCRQISYDIIRPCIDIKDYSLT